jgi:hypothetical protein
MKYLILLLALTSALAFSRKHLSRKAYKTHVRHTFNLSITAIDQKIIKNVIFDGQLDVDVPIKGNTITMLTKNDGDIKNLLFFEKLQNCYYQLTTDIGFCTRDNSLAFNCFLRYGPMYILAALVFKNTAEEVGVILSGKSITEAKDKYLIDLSVYYEGRIKGNLSEEITRKVIDNDGDFVNNKHELACIYRLKLGHTNCDINSVYTFLNFADTLEKANIDYESFSFNQKKKEDLSTAVSKVISMDVGEFDKILSKLQNGTSPEIRSSNANILEELKISIIEKTFTHLGILGKKYEVYDINVNKFFNTYLTEVYFPQAATRWDINSINGRAFSFLVEHIMSQLQIPHYIHYMFISRLNYDGILIKIFDHTKAKLFTEYKVDSKMLFLREQFINEEKTFFKIIKHIEYLSWHEPRRVFEPISVITEPYVSSDDENEE